MPLSYKARRRWSLFILIVALPAYIVVTITVVNMLERMFGRPPIAVEFVIYVVLGIIWAMPLKKVILWRVRVRLTNAEKDLL
ncbi:MAG: DUF2842 domain-containing protein, partial [Pseudomonadota bacterium]